MSRRPTYCRGMDVMVTFPYSSSPTAIHAEQRGRVARVFEMPDGRRAVAIALGVAGVGEDLVDASGRKLGDESPRLRGTDQSDQRGPLVVAMDADPGVRESLKAYLTTEGYEVIAVNNPVDAREVLNLFTPALVIAEIEGDDLPGYALCAHVKGTPRLKRVPVVLTTSSAYPSDYSSAHSLGAIVCMAKPYKQERLAHIVRLLAPLPTAKLDAPPPRPADPSRRPGSLKRPRQGGTEAGASNVFGFWPFRPAK
ncbi:MAG TPA: response regulator [Candidatus Acidoferrum sp.]|nr:response regulator [Candidatus Acidoferrum sp.]